MAGPERIDPRMLQKSADKGFHANIVGESGDAGPQTAYAADHDVDLDAGAARRIESVDDLRIDERIAFDPDLRRPAEPGVVDLVGNISQQRFLERDRRNRHLLETIRLRITGDEIENARDVASDSRIS